MRKILLVLAALSGVETTAFARCDGKYVINQSSKLEARVGFVALQIKEPVIYCLDLPVVPPEKMVGKNPIIEFNSINLGNAQCSNLRMVVTNPQGVKLEKSNGSQPGTVGKYLGGRWHVKLVLKEGCTKYTLGARWSVKP